MNELTASVFILIGFSFCLAGVIMLVRNLRIRRNGIETSGLVIDYEVKKEDGTEYFYPVVEFQNEEGDSIRKTLEAASPIKLKEEKDSGILFKD